MAAVVQKWCLQAPNRSRHFWIFFHLFFGPTTLVKKYLKKCPTQCSIFFDFLKIFCLISGSAVIPWEFGLWGSKLKISTKKYQTEEVHDTNKSEMLTLLLSHSVGWEAFGLFFPSIGRRKNKFSLCWLCNRRVKFDRNLTEIDN